MPGIIDKLKMDPGLPLWLINVPGHLLAYFEGFITRKSLTGKIPVAQVLAFARSKKELDELADALKDKIDENTRLWFAFPKKSGSIRSDISRDNGWESIAAMNYEGVTAISIDEDWSALRFKSVKVKTPYVPPVERQVEGIDFIKRKVTLPADAKAAIKKHKGLEQFFESMSFSHQKEYVQEIVTAKKPETRVRRIEKMVNMLLETKTQKELKKK